MKILFKIFVLLVSTILFFITIVQFTVIHENLHQIIYRDYGVDSYVEYNLNPFSLDSHAYTIPYNFTLALEKCNDTCNLAHEINEIVGYNIELLICIFFITAITILIYNLTKR